MKTRAVTFNQLKRGDLVVGFKHRGIDNVFVDSVGVGPQVTLISSEAAREDWPRVRLTSLPAVVQCDSWQVNMAVFFTILTSRRCKLLTLWTHMPEVWLVVVAA